ncbi:hypothetical protein [Candidatus Parabeggiatoa sp. HSG14]|uniref:hypothetical protein n=1 Tax=Candidatus Parabeggiatoa sp. HSG14 TaxID=3055593 RepID=UPI0025A755FD|nr:hypothetical protein [Thiotrichales bacterium HSG14]
MLLDGKLKDNPFWKWAIFFRSGLLCLFLFFQVMPVWANAGDVGYVDNLKVDDNFKEVSFKWVHNEKTTKVKWYSPVYNGDTIIVLSKQAEIRLTFKNGEEVTLTYQSTHDDNGKAKPYSIEVKACSGWWCSMTNWVGDLINDPPPKRLTAISKGEVIKVKVLNEGSVRNNKLEAGKTEVHFAWAGGKAPYTIRFQQKSKSRNKRTWHCPGDDVCSSRVTGVNDGDKVLRIAVPQQEPGGFKFKLKKSYYVKITDANGTSANRGFTVVSKHSYSSDELVKRSEWRFEAYQQSVGEAEIVRMGLEAGSRP